MDYRRNGLGSLLVAGADFCLKLCQRVYDILVRHYNITSLCNIIIIIFLGVC